MSTPEPGGSRIRAYLQFVAAVCYFFLARSLARHGGVGLAGPEWAPMLEQAMLVFLLLLGYAGFGSWMDRQSSPVSAQGLPRRAGLLREAGLGLSVGWSIAVICVLPLVVVGGIEIVLVLQTSAWGWLLADAAFFALVALAEEIAFRGYGFQRFAHAVGPIGASLGFAAFYAIVQALLPGSNHASIAVSVAFSLVLSMAYLRTRALWLSWGINFGWKASRALVFGLAGTWVAFFAFLAALPVVYRLTRDLDYRYNAPVIVPGGIPVDLDAAARAQHEAATREAEPPKPALIQILPLSAPPRPVPTETVPPPDSN